MAAHSYEVSASEEVAVHGAVVISCLCAPNQVLAPDMQCSLNACLAPLCHLAAVHIQASEFDSIFKVNRNSVLKQFRVCERLSNVPAAAPFVKLASRHMGKPCMKPTT